MSSKIQARSLVDAVTEQLESAIIAGELAPGQRIREQTLAVEMGISRGPLREAIRRLEGRRLLERTANIGVRVAELSAQRLDELLVVRESLEGTACRLAAERLSDEEIDSLREMLNSHTELEGASSGEGYYQQGGDFDFHLRIAKASQNEFLVSTLMGDLYDLLRIYRYKSSTMHGRAAQALEEHHAILDALSAHDPEKAEQAMRTHIRNARVHAKLTIEKVEEAAE